MQKNLKFTWAGIDYDCSLNMKVLNLIENEMSLADFVNNSVSGKPRISQVVVLIYSALEGNGYKPNLDDVMEQVVDDFFPAYEIAFQIITPYLNAGPENPPKKKATTTKEATPE